MGALCLAVLDPMDALMREVPRNINLKVYVDDFAQQVVHPEAEEATASAVLATTSFARKVKQLKLKISTKSVVVSNRSAVASWETLEATNNPIQNVFP